MNKTDAGRPEKSRPDRAEHPMLFGPPPLFDGEDTEIYSPRRERPRRRDAEQRNKLAASQLVELHSIPDRQGRIAGYPIGEDQSGGTERGSVASPENQLRSASS
jgi:hypothetical protein